MCCVDASFATEHKGLDSIYKANRYAMPRCRACSSYLSIHARSAIVDLEICDRASLVKWFKATLKAECTGSVVKATRYNNAVE